MISKNLIKRTLQYHKELYHETFVVKPSLPILYFGDLKRYKSSNIKVVTVGKNPSDNEFRISKSDSFSFVRFPKWRNTEGNLIETLNAYFRTIPLKNWFSSFEPILNGMDCSYYGRKAQNIVIHTDICSPIATSPTWSNLKKIEQEKLFTEGHQIWLELLEELQPDYILVSIPIALFSKVVKTEGKKIISFKEKKDGSPRKKNYEVSLHKFQLKSGKTTNVIFGSAANKPFDTITNEQKKEIGKEVKKID